MATVAIPAAKWSWESPYPQVRTSNSLDADAQLVERCLGGQEAAWEDLVRVHTRRVYSICYRFTNSDSEAQDLTQDVSCECSRTCAASGQARGCSLSG